MAELGQKDILLTIVKLLTKYKISYLLSGSFAVSYYGYPRSTHDIDFVIEAKQKDLPNLIDLVSELGKSYLVDVNQITKAVETSSQFNIYHVGTGIKIDFWPIRDNSFEKNKFKKAKELIIDRQKIKVITAEDLILTKLLWSKKVISERHLRDCTGILKIQGDKLEMSYLLKWVNRLKLKSLFDEIIKADY